MFSAYKIVCSLSKNDIADVTTIGVSLATNTALVVLKYDFFPFCVCVCVFFVCVCVCLCVCVCVLCLFDTASQSLSENKITNVASFELGVASNFTLTRLLYGFLIFFFNLQVFF